MKRSAALSIIVLALAAGWGVYRSLPSQEWACVSRVPIECQHRGTLDLDSPEFDTSYINEIDVSPGGDLLAVALWNGIEDHESGAAVLVDPATGKPVHWLVRGDEVLDVWRIRFSPDGSLVVASVTRIASTPGSARASEDVDVYRTDTGERVGSFANIGSCLPFGFSEDNAFVDCGGYIIDLASGTGTNRTDEEYGTSSSRRRARGLDGVTVDIADGELRLNEFPESGTATFDWTRRPSAQTAWLSLDRSNTVLAVLEEADEQPWHGRWRQLHRNHPGSTLTLFDVETQASIAQVDIGASMATGGWDATGERLVVVQRRSHDYLVLETP